MSLPYDKDSLVKHLAEEIKFASDSTRGRKSAPHRIKHRGEFISAASGKTVWPNIGGAKNALTRTLKQKFSYIIWAKRDFNSPDGKPFLLHDSDRKEIGYVTWGELAELEAAFVLEVMKDIEFVPVTTEDYYQKKK